MSTEPGSLNYPRLMKIITAERMRSYLSDCGDDVPAAFELHEWNAHACGAIMETTGMVEVVVRNQLDRQLRAWALGRNASEYWFDAVPLDDQGRNSIGTAEYRTRRRPSHGRVLAELSFGFWRFLVAKRYLTNLWMPALKDAFPFGPVDPLTRQGQVAKYMDRLGFVRNRAAHHEPIHRRDLARDLEAATRLMSMVDPTTSEWLATRSPLPKVIRERPQDG